MFESQVGPIFLPFHNFLDPNPHIYQIAHLGRGNLQTCPGPSSEHVLHKYTLDGPDNNAAGSGAMLRNLIHKSLL